MPRKTGQSRIQYGLFATPLEEMIAPDSMVRVIDAFVDAIDLAEMGFKTTISGMGASSYDPAVLLKIYFYGYLNRIRSSRMLERECVRNIELFWLTDRQTPSYHTISTFRTSQQKDEKDKILFCHRKALKSVFRYFVDFCNAIDLLGKQILLSTALKSPIKTQKSGISAKIKSTANWNGWKTGLRNIWKNWTCRQIVFNVLTRALQPTWPSPNRLTETGPKAFKKLILSTMP